MAPQVADDSAKDQDGGHQADQRDPGKEVVGVHGGSGLSGEMHGENLPVQRGQEPAGRTHFTVAGGDGFDVVAFGGEVAAHVPDGGGIIRIPIRKHGVVAHLCAVDEQEGVILAEGIVHASCLVTVQPCVAPI